MIDKDIKKLEEKKKKMESDELPLEESLKIFNEGIALIRQCNKKLEETELKISEILKDNSGELVEKELE